MTMEVKDLIDFGSPLLNRINFVSGCESEEFSSGIKSGQPQFGLQTDSGVLKVPKVEFVNENLIDISSPRRKQGEESQIRLVNPQSCENIVSDQSKMEEDFDNINKIMNGNGQIVTDIGAQKTVNPLEGDVMVISENGTHFTNPQTPQNVEQIDAFTDYISHSTNEADLAFCEATSYNFSKPTNNHFDFGKESLGILPDLHLNSFLDHDLGRESLGILHMNFDLYKVNAEDLNTPLLFEPQPTNNKSSPVSDLFPSKRSYKSSMTVSFNSESLECSAFSQIYSLRKSTPDIFNIGMDSSDFGQHLRDTETGRLRLFPDYRARIRSLQLPLSDIPEHVPERNAISENLRDLKSESKALDAAGCEDDVFNDSVFIEAKHIATKIADGSIFDEDEGLLDSTAPPILLDVSYVEGADKCDTESVFKCVDKLMPPQVKLQSDCDKNESDCAKKHCSAEQNISNSSSVKNTSRNTSNEKGSFYNSFKSNTSRSKEAIDIIQNLSVIIDTECKDFEMKTEGQNLLSSLASILSQNSAINSKDKNSLDDSGHSSIECDAYGEPMEPKTKGAEDNDRPLDLSVNAKPTRRLSQSFSNSVDSPKTSIPKTSESMRAACNSASSSNASLEANRSSRTGSSMNSTNLSNTLLRLKPKKIEKSGATKVGPLKAVIPVGNMAKANALKKICKIPATPPRTKDHASIFKSKKTSTPINEPNLKPMAQSTPGAPDQSDQSGPRMCSTQLRKKKFDCPVSPLTKPNSFLYSSTANKSDQSTSSLNVSSYKNHSSIPSAKAFNRRKSASDLLGKGAPSRTLQRSNSVSKAGGMTSVLSKVRENLSKATSLPKLGFGRSGFGTDAGGVKKGLGENGLGCSLGGKAPVGKLRSSVGKENARR